MVTLKNIRRNNDIIECDFYPEDSTLPGHMIVNLDSGDITSVSLPEGYENTFSYTVHAHNGLVELSKKEKLPEQWLVMWY